MVWFNWIAGICSIFGAVFSLFAWINAGIARKVVLQEQERKSKKIKIILQNGAAQRYELPGELHRFELTRAEILGRLGMIPKKDKGQDRFKLGYTNTLDFLRDINDISKSTGEFIFKVPCTKEEFEQFEI